MKKYSFIFAALAVIAAGCAKEDNIAESQDITVEEASSVVFTAGIDTKAHIDGTAVNWDASDAITVWNGTAAAEFTTTDSGATATFTTTAAFASAASYVALYPADAGASFSAGSVSTTLPEAQTAAAGTFDPAANLAVASSTTTALAFSNLVSYLKFTVPAGMDDLTSVSFKGNAGEKVAGAATVNVGTKAITATGSETATLSGTFTEGETYYLAIAPQEFSSGYTVTINRAGGSYEMASGKDVTFARSESRNIGELRSGEDVVILGGTAIGTITEMTPVPKPSNITNHDDVFTFRGVLSEGRLSIKEKYAAGNLATDIVIPGDGEYHIMYNKSTGRIRVYAQDIYTHLGKATPMDNGAGTYYYPERFTLNDMTVSDGAALSLRDYNGASTGVTLTVDSSAASGTWKNDNENVFGASSNRATNSPYVDDDYFPSYGWGRPSSFTNAVKTSDSEDILFTLSGLDNSARYDMKVCGIRWNSSANIRVAVYSVGDNSVEVDTGLPSAGTVNLNTFKEHVVYFDNLSPSSSEITLKMHSVTKHRDAQGDDFSEAFICFIYISKIVYAN